MATVTDTKRNDKAPSVDAEALLETIRELLAELRPQERDKLQVTLDSSLDRDLGLDSLSLMELLLRIERRFSIALSEEVVGRAETPRDLLHAIQSAAPEARVAPAEPIEAQALPEEPVESAPDAARTLLEALDWHVARHPERVHVHLYVDRRERPERITYQALQDGARRVAAGLRARGLEPGQAVAIMLPTSAEYLYSFIGTLLAGGIPVPIYPPTRMSQLEDHVRRHAGILSNAGATVLITFPEAKTVARLLKAHAENIRSVATVADLSDHGALGGAPAVGPDDVAFLQYTSGSTGSPKGVILSHANLLTSIRAMGQAVEVTSQDIFVSWLPLYHDMGLIGAWLGSLCYGFPLVLMSPLAFLHNPSRWLWAVHSHRATLSAGPNFAYELCLRRITDEELRGLDLGSWRLAFNGAEPVSPDTVTRFQERFARYGLRPEAIAPVYGLAEATLGVAFPALDRAPWIDRIKRDVLAREGRAVPAEEGETDMLRVVSCGQPLPGFQVRIVDETGHEMGEREEGRVEFKGPATTRGYYRNPEATRELFHGEWLDSGDQGYIASGEVFITSRRKDVVIRAGRNIYPYELEERVGDMQGIRKGCVAVFGAASPESRTERLVVLAETRESDPGTRTRLRERINQLAVDMLGTAPDDIVLAPPYTVLKTSSGKIRRSAVRELYEQDRLATRTRSVWMQFLRMAWTGTLPQLRRLRRVTLSMTYAGYVLALFAVIGPLTWCTVVVMPGLERRWRFFGFMGRTLLRLARIPFSVSGREHLPTDRPFVLATNHQSYLDGMVLIAALPQPVSFVAKRELLGSFIPRMLLRRLGVFFVERFDKQRGVEDSRQIAQALCDGQSLGYFPEGTFIRMPGLLPFHLGAFVAAVEGDAPVVPVAIRGTRSILRSGSNFPRPGAIQVTVGEPIAPEATGADGRDVRWKAAIRLRDATRAEILAHCAEPDLAHLRSVTPGVG